MVLDYIDLISSSDTDTDKDRATNQDSGQQCGFELGDYIITIDVAKYNFAYAVVNRQTGAIEAWETIKPVSVKSTKIHDYAVEVSKAINYTVMTHVKPGHNYTVVVEEQPRFLRSNKRGSSGSNFHAIVNNCSLEAAVHASFYCNGIRTVTLHPVTVASKMGLQTGNKKRDAVMKVIEARDKGDITVDDFMWKCYLEKPKKDDLADCIMLYLTYVREEQG